MLPPKLALAALAAVLSIGGAARAAVFVVNSNGDVGSPGPCESIERSAAQDLTQLDTCTLREAVASANLLPGDDEIVFNLAGAQIITLIGTVPIDESIDLNGELSTNWTNAVEPLTALVIRGGGGAPAISIASGSTLEVLSRGAAVNTTIEDDITGEGGLTKGGNGTLLLTGSNDFGGVIDIDAGTLRGDTGAIPGGTALDHRDVFDSGTLSFDQDTSDAEDFFGDIQGTGRLEKLGGGTLFLKGANTFSGGTTLSAGTLKGFVAATGSSLQGDIVNNATLVFEQDAMNGTFADDITGSGSVTKNGTGTLTLTGNNTFTGPLTISAGIVIADTAALRSNVSLGSGAGTQLIFDQGTLSGSHGGAISGGNAGGITLIKRGTGKLTLTGNNSFLGDISVEMGELEGSTSSLPGDVLLGAAGTIVSFNQTGTGSYDDVISGPGALVKRGGGTVNLSVSQNFTGGTTIEAGTLGIGSGVLLPGDVVLQGNGTLAGLGRVAGNVAADGTVAPGDSINGTLQVGSINFGASSALAVNIAETGSDRLLVDGNAVVALGTEIQATFGSLDRTLPFSFTLLEAGTLTTAGISDDDLVGDAAFFEEALVEVGETIVLQLTPNGATLPDFAETPNQRAVGDALEAAFAETPHDPDLDTVFGVISGLSPEDQSKALADMSGEQLTEFATARLAISDRFQTSLHERIRGVAWRDGEGLISQRESDAGVFAANPIVSRVLPGIGSGGTWPTAFAGQSMSSILDSSDGFGPAPGELGVGGWIDGYGLFGTLEGDSGGPVDLDYLIGGFSLGMDYRFHPNWIVGVAGGYAHTELDYEELSGNQSADTGQGALYLGYVTPWLQIGGSGRFGYSAMSTSRDIDFMSRDTDADFDGFDAGGRLEAAVDLFELRGVELQPLASISYTHVQQDEIDESGADSLDLTGDEEEVDSIVSGLGGRVHGVLEIDDELWLHPELRARWNHEFGDTERQLSARIGGEPGAVFEVSGAEFPSDTGVIGVSWTLVAAGRLHAFVDYDVTVAPELIQHGVAAGAKFVW